MAQAGIHALVGVAIRKWAPQKAGVMLGVLLGSLLPDADNFIVAVATVMKRPIEGIHRTATHSLLTVVLLMAIIYTAGKLLKKPSWAGLGLGLGIGMLLHILVDIILWFDGVAIFWPLAFDLNLWESFTPATWWESLMSPLELGFLALFFFALDRMARREKTDLKYLPILRIWTILEVVLFAIFLVLAYTLSKGFATLFGAVYLLSLILAIGITIRMRTTIETTSGAGAQQRVAAVAGD